MAADARSPKLAFHARLERIAVSANYFAFKVPSAISQQLGTRGPVPVTGVLNGKTSFMVSLAPIGGGRHLMRVKREAREAAGIGEGDEVHVALTIHQHSTPMPIPPDLSRALQSAGALPAFESMTLGKRKMVIGSVNEAAKPETRERRVQKAVEEALEQKERVFDRQARAAKAKSKK
jgi:hypothetical protein